MKYTNLVVASVHMYSTKMYFYTVTDKVNKNVQQKSDVNCSRFKTGV